MVKGLTSQTIDAVKGLTATQSHAHAMQHRKATAIAIIELVAKVKGREALPVLVTTADMTCPILTLARTSDTKPSPFSSPTRAYKLC